MDIRLFIYFLPNFIGGKTTVLLRVLSGGFLKYLYLIIIIRGENRK